MLQIPVFIIGVALMITGVILVIKKYGGGNNTIKIFNVEVSVEGPALVIFVCGFLLILFATKIGIQPIKPGNEEQVVIHETSEPIFVAAANGDIELAKSLIKQGTDVNARTKDLQTPLHYAVANNYPRVVGLLIQNKADINAKNKYGDTPLSLAEIKQRTEIIQLLRQAGAQ